jgi:5-(carboxyamino)imidazole ribonucleotide synthase
MTQFAPILPPAMLGMLGGGQLGRYFVIAARKLGYRVTVLDPDPESPAACMADRHLIADFEDPMALAEIAATCAAVSTEFENVPAASLARLASSLRVAPSAESVAIAQDRIREKGFFRDSGLPVGPFRVIHSRKDFEQAREFPGVLKRARFGYDGKGQARVGDRAEAAAAWEAMGSVPCVLEALVQLDLELSVVLARGSDGEVRAFPVAENRHTNGILDVTIAPARVPEALAAEAVTIASTLAEKLGYIGTLGVEFFVTGGRLFLNEMAPRPHNSGHYTIDACPADQFEQQLRALCGLPLADARALAPAVMVNLLGDIWQAGDAPDWTRVLATPGARLHLYGKSEPRVGRKMGHFTVLDASREAAVDRALALRAALGVADG